MAEKIKDGLKLDYKKTILTGFGFLATSIAWAIYDPYITKILNKILSESSMITDWSNALAKAILTYIIEQIGSKTLCATHFHELIELGHSYSQVQNYKVLTSSINGQIIFLHKVVKGEEQNSFGAEVAQLSGLPEVIIQNAKKIMKERETHESN